MLMCPCLVYGGSFVKMKKLTVFAFIIICSLREGQSQQDVDMLTFSAKGEETLECMFTGQPAAVQWFDDSVSAIDSLCTFLPATGAVTDVTANEKYKNFIYIGNSTTYNLIITSVEKDDGGTYRCALVPGGQQITYQLTVEALPDTFELTCINSATRRCGGPDEALASSVDCRCTANEVSPRSLQLEWSDSPNTVTRSETVDAGDYFNVISEATVSPTSSDESVTCSLTGYNSTGVDSTLITRTYNFVPPSCSLSVSYDDTCTSAELECECTEGMPDTYIYSFFFGNKTRITDSDSSTATVKIAAGEMLTFHCRACNGIYGEKSLATFPGTICEPATTPADMSTKETPGTILPVKGLSTGAKIGISVGVVLVVAAVGGVVVYLIFFRGPSTSSKGNNSAVSGGNTNPSFTQPAYDVVKEDTQAKSDDNTDGNGKNSTNSDPPEYAAVSKPLKTAEPKAAPRSSAPSAGGEPEKVELQYADLDHGNRGPSNKIHQPADDATEYATVQSVIV